MSEKNNSVKVGIITFHCADNYGAMLQAYGLKKHLRNLEIKADIVRYEPMFMTGRHWWFPYVPIGGAAGCLWIGWTRWRQHRRMGADFFKLKKNMRLFREKYLLEPGYKKMLFSNQLKKLPYRYYIVGSDQIWNPSITCGLRKVYFGCFRTLQKKKVIAYAASFGGASVSNKYDKKISEYLKCVDIVSLREAAAVPYVKRLCGKEVRVVIDPVFLLKKADWEKIEEKPVQERYILVYFTENNPELWEYVKTLSLQKGLSIVELRTNKKEEQEFFVDYVAGPAEFLGYIHYADYVVTNSFHGVAFSIIYQKKFMVFCHSSFQARIENILQICGLEERIYQNNKRKKIDDNIDWLKVKAEIEKQAALSTEYLLENIMKDK